MYDIKGAMNTFISKMDMSVQNLKNQITKVLDTEGLQRKKDNEDLETQSEELAIMKDETKAFKMGSNCSVSRAASTGFGLGSGAYVRPTSLAPRWMDT